MSNFSHDIETAANGDPIEGCAIGEFGWSGYSDSERTAIDAELFNKVLPWSQAKVLLDYEYSTGYGVPDCHAVTVWTTTRVLFVVQYDGSTRIHSVPRALCDHKPAMPGG